MYHYSSVDDEDILGFISDERIFAAVEAALKLFDSGCYAEAHDRLCCFRGDSWVDFVSLSYSFQSESEEEFTLRHLREIKCLAGRGNVLALYTAGIYYDSGSFVGGDKRLAFGYFKEAAEKGHVRSMYLYGVALFFGIPGVLCKDVLAGLRFLKLAAEGGDAEASKILEALPGKA